MGLEFAGDWRAAGWLITGLSALVGLVWLLRSGTKTPVTRAFALVLLLIFLNVGLFNQFYWSDGTALYWLGEVPDNLLGLAHVLFLITWLRFERGRRVPPWLPIPFLVVMAALTAWWLSRPDLRSVFGADYAPVLIGPLYASEQILELAAACAVGVLFLAAGLRRSSLPHILAGFGYGAWGVVTGIAQLVSLFEGRLLAAALGGLPPSMRPLAQAYHVSSIGAGIYFSAAAVYLALRHGRAGHRRLVVATTATLVAASIVLSIGYVATTGSAWLVALGALAGLATALMPVTVVLLLQCETSLGREQRLWTALRRAALPAAMLASFFVISELAQVWVAGAFGPAIAVVLTAPLVLLFAPIQRAAERFGHALAPRVDGTAMDRPQREAVYERQVRMTWADGAVSPRERLRLTDLRRSLGLPAERAEEIEQDILARR